MITVHQLTYNPFAENTYVLADKHGDGILIDPGMYSAQENANLFEYLNKNKIQIVQIVLTHAHIDHVFGLHWAHNQFGLIPRLHKLDERIYNAAASMAEMYGLDLQELPAYHTDLVQGETLKVDGESLDMVLTPGHSPGSISYISHEHRFIIGGDVLFQGSIGRTDLPGGDYDTLLRSIRLEFMSLTDDYKVYSGHGPVTTIGQERKSNPFLQDF